mgnify:CR=1 FL=1
MNLAYRPSQEYLATKQFLILKFMLILGLIPILVLKLTQHMSALFYILSEDSRSVQIIDK